MRPQFRWLWFAARPLAIIALGVTASPAQDQLPFVPTAASRYYDFWEGTWYRVSDGKPATTASFVVSRTAHPASFREEWLTSDGRPGATALRVWDKTEQRWMYTWASGNGLFQSWEGRQNGDDWYMFRRFDIAGDRYLSRQAMLPVAPDRVAWVSDKSYDEGKSWQPRFRFELVRVRSGSPDSSAQRAVRQVVELYLRALQGADGDALRSLFHRAARITFVRGDTVASLDVNSYVSRIRGPAAAPGQASILEIVQWPTVATARTEMKGASGTSHDFLTFVLTGGSWTIISKSSEFTAPK
jgi:hypothetical protein